MVPKSLTANNSPNPRSPNESKRASKILDNRVEFIKFLDVVKSTENAQSNAFENSSPLNIPIKAEI